MGSAVALRRFLPGFLWKQEFSRPPYHPRRPHGGSKCYGGIQVGRSKWLSQAKLSWAHLGA